MYLCIIDTNQHHDGTTTYPPHTLGSLRFRNGGAGTTGLYPDTWDFGTIRETDGRVSHTFTARTAAIRP